METESVAIFIDGANVFKALWSKFGRSFINYEILVNKLLNGRKILRTYYYTALPDQRINPVDYRKRQSFVDKIRTLSYFEVKLGRLEYYDDNGEQKAIEKGVDISLAVDMLDLAFKRAYSTAILVSGDSDFERVIDVVKGFGLHVENARVEGQYSKTLDHCCDKLHILDGPFLEECWMPHL